LVVAISVVVGDVVVVAVHMVGSSATVIAVAAATSRMV
jgi:hypothetical protein